MNRKPPVTEILSVYFNVYVVPWLYNFSMWLFLSAAASIFMQDIFQGTAFASAVSLFYITRGYYLNEMYRRSLANSVAQSVEDAK